MLSILWLCRRLQEDHHITTVELLYNGTLETEESGLCREVAIEERLKQEWMYGLSAKKSGCCSEVAVSEGLSVLRTAQVKTSLMGALFDKRSSN